MNRIYSKLFNEHANVTDDGSVTFDSGATYSADEVRMLKRTGAAADALHAIHEVKKALGGDVEFCGHFKKDVSIDSDPFNSAPISKKTVETESVQLSLF
jgi:hypothetical protein